MAKNQNKNPTHTMIIVSKNRKKMVIFAFTLMLIIFTMLINNLFTHHEDWKTILAPLIAIGLMGLLVPPSEVWNYVPWQDRPERMEKLFFEREKKDGK